MLDLMPALKQNRSELNLKGPVKWLLPQLIGYVDQIFAWDLKYTIALLGFKPVLFPCCL